MNENLNCKKLTLENKCLREEVLSLTQSNNELLAHKQQLDAIMDNAPVEINLKDREGRYTRVSKVFETSFGVKNDNLVGMFPITAHGPKQAAAAREHDLSVLNLGKAERRELISDSNTKDQRLTLSATKFPIFNSDGEISGLGTIDIDITDIRHVEEELQRSHMLYHQAEEMGNMGHYRWNLENGQLMSCSEQFARIYGFNVCEALNYFTSVNALIDLIHPEDKERFRQATNVYDLPNNKKNIQYRIIILGKTRHIHLRRQVEVGKNGMPSQVFGIVQDITEIRQVEEELQRSHMLYHQAEEM
ncbi:MAG: PAS domain-containing protein, partial [Pseudomonadales bacterium]